MPKVEFRLKTTEINRAIRELRAYQSRVRRLGNELAQRLADIGVQNASIRFANAQYDGTNDVVVTAEATQKGYAVTANGHAVCFIEFGSGVHYNSGVAYPLPKPAGIADIGHYGKGHGSKDVWRYQGDPGTNGVVMTPEDDPTVQSSYVLTQGNPAQMPMYYASEEMRANIQRIAQEVLRG